MESQDDKIRRKDQVRKSLETIRQNLLLRQPFIASIMMQQELVPVFDSRVPTACTDGKHIFFSCRYFERLTPEERSFVLAHEIWHTVLMHAQRRQDRERELFDTAADLEIHFILQEEHFTEPFIPPHNPWWQGLSAEEIYEQLKKLKGKTKIRTGGKTSKNIKGIRPDGGMDIHLYDQDVVPGNSQEKAGGTSATENPLAGAQKNRRKRAGKNKAIDPSSDAIQRQKNADDNNGDVENDSPDDRDPDFQPVPPSSTTETVRRQLIQATQRIEQRHGNIPGGMVELIRQIRKPKLRWQELLKQYVSSIYGGERRWLPPARRYIGSGLYLPSRRDMRLEIVVALDTSGSTVEYIPQFVGELNGILKSFGNYDLTLIQCDYQIQKVDHYNETKPLRDVRDLMVMGGGGTNFNPVFDYISKKISNVKLLLFLTDGYGDAPLAKPYYSVIWVLPPNGQAPRIWGQKLQFRD